jgi:hypothetical protein
LSTGDYKLTIRNIKDKKGEEISNLNIAFKVIYVAPSNIPEDELERKIKQSDSFESNYPIIHDLPQSTYSYRIDYKVPNLTQFPEAPLILYITSYSHTSELGDMPESELEKIRIEQIRKSRTEALDYIRSKGYRLEDYQIRYAEPILLDEFTSGYIFGD